MDPTTVVTDMIEAGNRGDWDAVMADWSEDAVDRYPDGTERRGRDEIRKGIAEMSGGMVSEAVTRIRRVHSAGNAVAVEYQWTATNTGPIAMPGTDPIPATGKAVDVPGCSVFTVDDSGRIMACQAYWDNLLVVKQLGLFG